MLSCRGKPAGSALGGNSVCHGSVDKGEQHGTTAVDEECGAKIAVDDGVDEVTALRELLERKNEDLRMAALIGQRLLDTQEELAAELEVRHRCSCPKHY